LLIGKNFERAAVLAALLERVENAAEMQQAENKQLTVGFRVSSRNMYE